MKGHNRPKLRVHAIYFVGGFCESCLWFQSTYFTGSFLKAAAILNCGSSIFSPIPIWKFDTTWYPEWLPGKESPKKRPLPGKFRTSTFIHPRWHVETPARGVSICNEGIPVVLVKGSQHRVLFGNKNHYAQIYTCFNETFLSRSVDM